MIIIDEAQSIPFGLLDPTLDLLNTLVRGFGATVIMTTATQPPFDRLRSMRGVDITELVDDPAEWSRASPGLLSTIGPSHLSSQTSRRSRRPRRGSMMGKHWSC